MVKRVVVAGCRYYNNYNEAKAFIDVCILNIRKQYRVVFLCGCCTGADALGERYAKENGFDVVRYPAQWEKHGNPQDRYEIDKWRKTRIMLFVFGMEKVGEQNL